MTHRAHPLTILANLWRVFYLIIIPVLRGFFYALQGDLSLWLRSAWVDILIFLAMLAIAVWRWLAVTYFFDDREFVLRLGWLVRRTYRINWNDITTVSALESFYLRPFRCAHLRADTIGGSAGKADFSILVWRDQAERILRRARIRDGERHTRQYIPKTRSILSSALLTSNSLGGVVFIAAFISQTGRLLGNEFSSLLIGTFEEAARLLAFGIPPAAAALAYLLLAGWLMGFLLAFFRYKNFCVSRSQNGLRVRGGLLTHREYCIRYGDINFIDIRQSITTKVLRLYSLYISAVGYAKHKDDISCVILTENRKDFSLHRERIFPAFSPAPRQLGPKKTAVLRFVGPAVAFCLLLAAAVFLLIHRFPGWRDFIRFVGLMLMVPAVYFLLVRTVDFHTNGAAKNGKYYTLRYSLGFSLHTVVIPEDKIVSVELRQSPIQQFSGVCDLLVCTRAEARLVHRCRNLDKQRLTAMFRLSVQ